MKYNSQFFWGVGRKERSLFFLQLLIMNNPLTIFFLCPVPEDQKPINEYISLRENSFTNWVSFSLSNYLRKLFSLFLNFFLFSLFFWNNIWLQTIFRSSNFFVSPFSLLSRFGEDCYQSLSNSLIWLLIYLFILLFRWKNLSFKFNQSRFIYEESSWFDSQVWEKPFSLLKNEKLMTSQRIEPILIRLTQTIFLLFLATFFVFLFSFLS